MTDEVVMVLTSKSFETMRAEGGSGNWRANEESIRRCRWLVAVRNRHSDWSQGDEDHGTAFLIGRVVGVKPSLHPEEKDRLVIVFDRYAQLRKERAWPSGHRNPVAYTTLKALGIQPDTLEWKDFTQRSRLLEASNGQTKCESPADALERARHLIAQSLSIAPSAVKISIEV
jgi:hypothetical protein